MKTYYFNTGVKLPNRVPNAKISPNGVNLIPFDCEGVPDNATFKYACNNPNLRDGTPFLIHNSALVSKYAYFQIN